MRWLLGVTALWLALATPAGAADCTVGDAACPDLQAALDQAAVDPADDVVRLPAGEFTRPGGFAAGEGGGALELVGEGEATRVAGPLRLPAAETALRSVTLAAPTLADRAGLQARGIVTQVRITGAAAAGVTGIEALPGAPLALHDVVVDATGVETALAAPDGAELQATHVTVAGGGDTAASGAVGLRSSIVAAGYPVALAGPEARAAYSNLAGTAPAGSQTEPVPGDPGFAGGDDERLRADSPLLDRGDPAPLGIDAGGGAIDRSEPQADLAGEVRVADADGNGTARRDLGAHERVPPAPADLAGNLLANPGGEAAAGGPPPGWAVTGGFTTESYGSAPFPTRAAGAAIGGDARFLAGGAAGDATAVQSVGLGEAAGRIDTGAGRATLSALVGGFRADGDRAAVEATFRGPSGEPIGSFALPEVTPAERGNATHLLPRSASVPVPPRTRSIEVALRATKAAGGAYVDAYFDDLGLAVSLPGLDDPTPTSPLGLRPFSGLALISGSAVLSRKTGRATLRLGCASATVGRCVGDLALAAVLRRRGPRLTVGRTVVSLAPGATRRVAVRLSPPARRYLRRHTRLRVRVAANAIDGQGVRRARTVPISVRRQRR